MQRDRGGDGPRFDLLRIQAPHSQSHSGLFTRPLKIQIRDGAPNEDALGARYTRLLVPSILALACLEQAWAGPLGLHWASQGKDRWR